MYNIEYVCQFCLSVGIHGIQYDIPRSIWKLMCGDVNGKGRERNEEKLLENGNVIYGSVCHVC